ncbi:DNA-binding protein [Pseudomonas citronellolis]|uniref:DNA-binding protein n=1 Tax=Pseudomonas citronellolis TaxID=53408 RepID=A0A1A9KFQ9_9PSED|nr:excisionase family protein [Pseudomonas citronellolis]ANI16646.1 DNA-binding protein [Pseudomonas citronellolis]
MGATEKITYHVAPGKWVQQELLPSLWGISTEAAKKYRLSGVWLEDKHWKKDPANRVIYCVAAIDNWLETDL